MHTHTLPLSEDSELTPSEMIVLAKRAGLDAICLTEHDAFRSDDEIAALCRRHDFTVIPGVEINTENEHLIVFGLKRWVVGMSRADMVKQLVDEAHGALLIAHPYRRKVLRAGDPDGLRYRRELDRACDNPLFRGADAIEVFNARANDRENAFSRELAARLNIRGFAGSDAHEPTAVGRAATYFERSVSNAAELIAELKEGRFRALSQVEVGDCLHPITASRNSKRGDIDFWGVERVNGTDPPSAGPAPDRP